MGTLKSVAVASLLAMVILPRVSSAMEIAMYDDMARQDQQEYLAYLVKATQDVLTDQGRPDLASTIRDLFRGPGGDRPSPGEVQFEEVLAKMRAYLAGNPRPMFTSTGAVEAAFTQNLILRSIQVPDKFHTSLKRLVKEKPFWPTRPLRHR
jgi:hypothetical protein